MRIRSIKPGFFNNDELAELRPLTRLLFIGLWCLADRRGRLEDRPRRIKAELLPYDDFDAGEMLAELERAAFVTRYESGGLALIQINTFEEHQRITGKEAEGESKFPAPLILSTRQPKGKQWGNNRETTETTEGKGREGKEGNCIAPVSPGASGEKEKGPKPEKAPRPADPVFEAFARHLGQDPKQLTPTAGRLIGIALAEIRKIAPNVTGNEIARRVINYRKHYAEAACTAPAIAKHWALIDNAPGQYRPTGPTEADKLRHPPAGWTDTLARLYPPEDFPATREAIAASDWNGLQIATRKEIVAASDNSGKGAAA